MNARATNSRPGGYVLLETVIATGLLIVGLAVIGAQVQDADRSVRTMERRTRAVELAKRQLAELEMGLIEFDSGSDVQDGDFGPRYPDFGWLVTTERTALDNVYLWKLEVLHHQREQPYRKDEFDFDNAETMYTLYSMHVVPPPVSFSDDLGLSDDRVTQIGDQLSAIGIEGLDINSFDPNLLQTVDVEQLLQALPVIMGAFGMDPAQLIGTLPPDLLQQLQGSGVLDGLSGLNGSTGTGSTNPPPTRGALRGGGTP